MRIFLCSLAVLGITVIQSVCAEDEPFLPGLSYCACRCCEKNKDTCFRHSSLPDTFRCKESLCGPKFCENWNKGKCGKDCFCKKCKSKLSEADYRCISFTKVPKGCKCDASIDCTKDDSADAMDGTMLNLQSGKAKQECAMPCFCRECRHAMPPSLYDICLKTGAPPAKCECKVACPSQEVIDKIHMITAQRKKNKGKSVKERVSLNIDHANPPDEAHTKKCYMQCFCDQCSEDNDKVQSTCAALLPKTREEGCKCKDITCPSGDPDVDNHCTLYCFCKGCQTDSRMSLAMLKDCKALTKVEQDCLCEKENCDVLDLVDKIPKPKQSDKKAKSKKGKLKPKKKQKKDEL